MPRTATRHLRVLDAHVRLQRQAGFPPSLGEVAEAIGVHRNNLTGDYRRLEAAGLATRGNARGRTAWTVTDEGLRANSRSRYTRARRCRCGATMFKRGKCVECVQQSKEKLWSS